MVTAFLVTSCANNYEVCDPDGDVFTALNEHAEEWIAYFENAPSENSLLIDLNESCCLIHNYREIDGLLVSTFEGLGPSATIEGRSGYYYSPDGQPRPASYAFGFEDARMNDNIFCYRRN